MTQDEAIDYMYSSVRGDADGLFFALDPEERQMIRENVQQLCKAWLGALKKNPDMRRPESTNDAFAIVAIALNDSPAFYNELKPYDRAIVRKRANELRKPKLQVFLGAEEKTERVFGHLRLVKYDE